MKEFIGPILFLLAFSLGFGILGGCSNESRYYYNDQGQCRREYVNRIASIPVYVSKSNEAKFMCEAFVNNVES